MSKELWMVGFDPEDDDKSDDGVDIGLGDAGDLDDVGDDEDNEDKK